MIRPDSNGRHHDDELLSAYMDGEIDATSARELEYRLEREPELAQRLAALRGVDEHLKEAFDTGSEEPLPERLRALVAATDENPDRRTSARPAKIIAMPRIAELSRRFVPVAAAASIALVVGLLAGRGPVPDGNGDPGILAGQNPLLPGSALFDVVASTPSGQSKTLADSREVTPEYSFRTPAGQVCRRLTVRGSEGVTTAVACRDAGAWRVRLARFKPEESASYAPAFGRADPFDNTVEAMMAGAPLDHEAERAALADNGEG